jgi:arginase family enzyme
VLPPEDWESADVILYGCPEQEAEAAGAAEAIRRSLMALAAPAGELKLCDLGSMRPGSSPEADEERLALAAARLAAAGKIQLPIGGSSAQLFGLFLAFEDLGQPLDYVHADRSLGLHPPGEAPARDTVNHRILHYGGRSLRGFTHLGCQRYFTPEAQLQLLRERHFAALRYGELAAHPESAEAWLRMADLCAVSLRSVRFGDAPGSAGPAPAGFTAAEICRIARYAGLGFQCRFLMIADYWPAADQREQTALLSALILWHFLEGLAIRQPEFPGTEAERSRYRRYSVHLRAGTGSIEFFEHPLSGRWWMEVPLPDTLGSPAPAFRLVPCTQEDCLTAQRDEIPERWWLYFNRMQQAAGT